MGFVAQGAETTAITPLGQICKEAGNRLGVPSPLGCGRDSVSPRNIAGTRLG